MSKYKIIGVIAGVLVAILFVTWGGIYVKGFFSKQVETQRAKVHENSLAYQRGLRDELNQLYLQYISADSTGKIAIKSVVLSKFGPVDTSDFPQHLQQFLFDIGVN